MPTGSQIPENLTVGFWALTSASSSLLPTIILFVPKGSEAQHVLICLNLQECNTRRLGGGVGWGGWGGASFGSATGMGLPSEGWAWGIKSSSHPALARGKSHRKYFFQGKAFYLKGRNMKHRAFRAPEGSWEQWAARRKRMGAAWSWGRGVLQGPGWGFMALGVGLQGLGAGLHGPGAGLHGPVGVG